MKDCATLQRSEGECMDVECVCSPVTYPPPPRTPGLLAPLHTFLQLRLYHLQSVTSACRAKQHQSGWESHRETILLSHNKSNNLRSSHNMFLFFFKTIQPCDFDLEVYFNLNNWSKTICNCQNLAQWLPQIDTMQLKGDVCLIWGCLPRAHPAPSGGGSSRVEPDRSGTTAVLL